MEKTCSECKGQIPPDRLFTAEEGKHHFCSKDCRSRYNMRKGFAQVGVQKKRLFCADCGTEIGDVSIVVEDELDQKAFVCDSICQKRFYRKHGTSSYSQFGIRL